MGTPGLERIPGWELASGGALGSSCCVLRIWAFELESCRGKISAHTLVCAEARWWASAALCPPGRQALLGFKMLSVVFRLWGHFSGSFWVPSVHSSESSSFREWQEGLLVSSSFVSSCEIGTNETVAGTASPQREGFVGDFDTSVVVRMPVMGLVLLKCRLWQMHPQLQPLGLDLPLPSGSGVFIFQG